MHLAFSHSFTMTRSSQSARPLALNTTKCGVQPPVTLTETGNGVIARQMTMSQTAWIFAAAAENGQERENVWQMLLICDASARDLVVCVPMEEMAEELHARFHFSLRKDWCMTVCILTRRPGVRRQLIIIRTGNGATVFLSVSRIIYCGRFNLGRDSHSKGGQLRALIRPCRCHSKIDPKVRVKAP